MLTSSGSTGGGGGRGGDAKSIISPNTSFGDIITQNRTILDNEFMATMGYVNDYN